MLAAATEQTPNKSPTKARDAFTTQVAVGSLGGTVVDQSGAVIPGVRVVLEMPKGGQKVTVTAEDGTFRFMNLAPANNYWLQFTREGFRVVRSRVTVQIGGSARLNVTMLVGGPSPTPTMRPTPRPTISFWPTPSPWASPSATGFPSPRPSATPTSWPSPTATGRPSPRPSTTPIPRPSPTAGKSPSPSPSASPSPTPKNGQQDTDWDALVTAEVQKLHDSKILFNPPLEMQQGAKERIEARISFADIGPALTEGLHGSGVPQIETLKVGPIMKVVLVGDQGAFHIEKFSSEEQTVAGKPFAQWEWDVTPLRSGNQTLHLQASASIYVPGRGEKPVDIPVIHKSIQVKVDRWYATKEFVGNNWQWLWTALIIPLGGWLWQRKRKTKRRAAGFR